jgi:diketogulonate reductase-like aldo/keto reductase
MEYTVLNNDVKMPMLGYGAMIADHAECAKCVTESLDAGYRLLDTAQGYYNEEAVGAGIRESGVARENIFVTSKIWITNAGYEKAKASIDDSLKKFGMDYLDLMLIHQPYGDYYGSYRAMEEAYKAGKLRAIGLSNFYPDRLIDITHFMEVTPAVNQVETHPYHQQKEAHAIMEKYHVQHEAWAPFAEGNNNIF